MPAAEHRLVLANVANLHDDFDLVKSNAFTAAQGGIRCFEDARCIPTLGDEVMTVLVFFRQPYRPATLIRGLFDDQRS